MEIRACIEGDLGALRSGWPTSDDIAGSHFQEQASGSATFLCAWDADRPLGWCLARWDGCIGKNARDAHPDSAEVIHLQVREHSRGAGVGTALLAEAEVLARARGFSQLAVSVGRDNGDAARLYLSLGYQPTGVIDAITYSWLDDQGTSHTGNETSELLVKQLR